MPEVGNALAPGHSDYTYTNSEYPAPGSYSIIRNNDASTNGKPYADFAVMHRDHTFKFNNDAYYGYYMIVNGTNQPEHSVYYADTVRNLCANSRYLFTAGITVAGDCGGRVELPNSLFHAETLSGQVLVENSGTEYFSNIFSTGTYFNLPPGETAVIIKLLSGPQIAGCETKLALDDIQLRIDGPSITAGFVSGTGWVGSLCAETHPSVNLTSSLGGSFTDPQMQWQSSIDGGLSWTDIPGEIMPDYTPAFNSPDTFLFRTRAAERGIYSNNFCNVVSNWVKVNVDGPPQVKIISNSPVCSGETIKLRVENLHLQPGPAPVAMNPLFLTPQGSIHYCVTAAPIT